MRRPRLSSPCPQSSQRRCLSPVSYSRCFSLPREYVEPLTSTSSSGVGLRRRAPRRPRPRVLAQRLLHLPARDRRPPADRVLERRRAPPQCSAPRLIRIEVVG